MTASSSSRSTIVTVVAILAAVIGVLNLCGSFAIITGGALLGGLGSIANQAAQQSGETLTAEEQQALAAVSNVGGPLITILGLAGLVVAIALLVDAVGLFQSKPWSWMLTIVLFGVLIIIQVITWLTAGFNIISLIWVIIAAAIVYLFYTNADVKRSLGQPA
jgi:hypothetical protein